MRSGQPGRAGLGVKGRNGQQSEQHPTRLELEFRQIFPFLLLYVHGRSGFEAYSIDLVDLFPSNRSDT